MRGISGIFFLVCLVGLSFQLTRPLRKAGHSQIFFITEEMAEGFNKGELRECRSYCDDAYQEYRFWYSVDTDTKLWTDYADKCQHFVYGRSSGNVINKSFQKSRVNAAKECAINFLVKKLGKCE